MGRTLFFAAADGIHGRELWKSDGTAAGTVLVKNINPNEPNRGSSNPENLTVVGRQLFFTARDGAHGRELWKSDGSRAGTVLVKNINPTDSGSVRDSDPSSLTAMGGRLFFSANDGTHGQELWKSDGSRSGTVLVKDINPRGSYYPGSTPSSPSSLTAMGGRLFFSADDGTRGEELWKSDGSRAGTVLVKDIDQDDIRPYDGHSPSSLTAMGGRLFFSADDGTRGEELWKSDGSRAGTVLIKNIDPTDFGYDSHYPGSYPSSLTAMKGRLYFSADDDTHGEELWRSDGSRAGTVLVRDIRPRRSFSGSDPSSLTAVGRRLFFSAHAGTHGDELWKSDGSRAGTVLVKNIKPDDSGHGYPGSDPSSLTAVEGRLLFIADNGTHGRELWRSDGSRAGTVLVKDIHPCSDYGESPLALIAVRGRLFFSADDGVHGRELWKSDGSRAGTVLVEDIKTGATR
jgi:ELWxxDGT repeat protein